VKSIEHHLIAYAKKVLGGLGAEAGMDRQRMREHLHACIDRWRAAYGDQVADLVYTEIKGAWKAQST
jgi:hypothetical protein